MSTQVRIPVVTLVSCGRKNHLKNSWLGVELALRLVWWSHSAGCGLWLPHWGRRLGRRDPGAHVDQPRQLLVGLPEGARSRADSAWQLSSRAWNSHSTITLNKKLLSLELEPRCFKPAVSCPTHYPTHKKKTKKEEILLRSVKPLLQERSRMLV